VAGERLVLRANADAGGRRVADDQQPQHAAGADPLRLPRVLIARSTHPGYFLLKLCTAYEDRRSG
jgi:hypothetical protein